MEAVNHPSGRTVIFTGGSLTVTPVVEPSDLVIAADSGYDLAMGHGITPDLLVGDLDSISVEGLADAERRGVPIERFPRDKDATDLELALRRALTGTARDVVVYGGEAGRIDHLIAVGLGLVSEEWLDLAITWRTGSGSVHPVLAGRPAEFSPHPGTTVSIVPVGTATGVTTTGLRWTLTGETLERGSTRGLSNVVVSAPATVSVESGAVLTIVTTKEDQP